MPSKPKAPELLTRDHLLDDFDCGVHSLNSWLKNRAVNNQDSGASRTYVVCSDNKAIAYYALATGAVLQQHAQGYIRRNMPDPIPVIVLGRLAVDLKWQGKNLGADLLADAVKRSLSAANIVGARALIVHALSDKAKFFYERYGFKTFSSSDPMSLMIALKV